MRNKKKQMILNKEIKTLKNVTRESTTQAS